MNKKMLTLTLIIEENFFNKAQGARNLSVFFDKNQENT